MTGKASVIPVLDVGDISLKVKEENISEEVLKTLGEELKNAFALAGISYLKNHGIDKNMIDEYLAVARKFFAQAVEVKQKHLVDKEQRLGWIPRETERANTDRPGDFKEGFHYIPSADDRGWGEFEDFQRYNEWMFDACKSLSYRILECLSVGLGLDKDFFATSHKSMGNKNNYTTLRTLYYPAILEESVLKSQQIRLGEHTDYGSMTLLFQDDAGGLEADIPGQGFVPVTPIPDTVLVNLGDLMQKWTSDNLIAPSHRVLIPEVEIKKREFRQSVAFFVYPYDEYVVKPIDGSDDSKAVSTRQYVREKLNSTY